MTSPHATPSRPRYKLPKAKFSCRPAFLGPFDAVLNREHMQTDPQFIVSAVKVVVLNKSKIRA